jgi:hypothetical protein
MDGGSFLGQALKTEPRSNAGDLRKILVVESAAGTWFPVFTPIMQLSARLKADSSTKTANSVARHWAFYGAFVAFVIRGTGAVINLERSAPGLGLNFW